LKSHVLGLALLSVAVIAASAPAHAQNGALTRSFVSSSGSDNNSCMIAAPCQSFAQAYTKVGANGIVAALDPGKYGSLIITGPVTINGNGWAAITGPAGNNAITINANSSDNIILTGLEIDGAGAAYNGIVFNTGGNFTVTGCTVQNFVNDNMEDDITGNGILIAPTSTTGKFRITNTTISNNDFGINYTPKAPDFDGVIDHVAVSGSASIGIILDARSIPEANPPKTHLTISDSIASNNTSNGIFIIGSSAAKMEVSIDSVTAGNQSIGIEADNEVSVLLSRSFITGNSNLGIKNQTSPNEFYSYGDNRVNFNASDIDNAMLSDSAR
jgi:hypothetical protein